MKSPGEKKDREPWEIVREKSSRQTSQPNDGMSASQRKVISIAAITLCLGIVAGVLATKLADRPQRAAAVTAKPDSSPEPRDFSRNQQAAPSAQEPSGLSEASPPTIPELPPSLSPEQALAMRRRALSSLDATVRSQTQGMYASFFQHWKLSPELQAKAIESLSELEREMAQQADEAAQTGTLPPPPSSQEMRSREVQRDQQLRSLLGDQGFAELTQYRASIPNRIIVDVMTQEGANLSETQSQQLLQILSEERQRVFGTPGVTRNLDNMPREQVQAIMEQDHTRLNQAVTNRVQSVLTPEQSAILQDVFSRFSP